MDFDILIVGAGPAGLCCALGMAKLGLRVGLLERQPCAALAQPAFDGREIALTHRSLQLLQRLGIWDRIAASEVAPLKCAIVLTGSSPRSLYLDHRDTRCAALGYLVPNHAIRRAAYETVAAEAGITLFADQHVSSLQAGPDAVIVGTGGSTLRARLMIAADSRFSECRRAVGIAADMLEFGRCMLVCRMQHELPHQETAVEWFLERCTVASLPLMGSESSFVITVNAAEAQRLKDMNAAQFAGDIESKFHLRLGRMQLSSTRHVYPLVASYARRFIAPRCALIGDAAVGMHPVTAHGFNLGLRSQDTLVRELRLSAGGDIGASDGLLRYESQHRRHSRPLYLATNAIVRLYTDPRPLAGILRGAALGIADRLRPFKQAALASLTAASNTDISQYSSRGSLLSLRELPTNGA